MGLGSYMNSDDLFEQAKTHIKERENKERLEKELKLLNTPMQQLLPEIFEEKRLIPNCFLRGALFGMVRKGRRKLVKEEKIFTMSQYEILFSGEYLDQNDLELWDTLIYLAKQKQVGDELQITLYELLKHMRMEDTGGNRKSIIARVKRLSFGQVTLKLENKEYFGSLIDDGFIDNNQKGKLIIKYNKRLAPLFIDGDYTLLSVDIRHLLGSNQLAKWLYNFYESHKDPIPFSIKFIQQLCRSDNNLKDFKYRLKIALELVKKAYFSVNLYSKWEYMITDNNFLLIYPNGKNNSPKIDTRNLLKTF